MIFMISLVLPWEKKGGLPYTLHFSHDIFKKKSISQPSKEGYKSLRNGLYLASAFFLFKVEDWWVKTKSWNFLGLRDSLARTLPARWEPVGRNCQAPLLSWGMIGAPGSLRTILDRWFSGGGCPMGPRVARIASNSLR